MLMVLRLIIELKVGARYYSYIYIHIYECKLDVTIYIQDVCELYYRIAGSLFNLPGGLISGPSMASQILLCRYLN